jgi:hypothetical protein
VTVTGAGLIAVSVVGTLATGLSSGTPQEADSLCSGWGCCS